MDKISLIRELNKSTIKKDEFERALEESGYDLPDMEDEYAGDMEDDLGDVHDEELDSSDEEGYNDDTGLAEDEIQDIVSWCEEECADMEDDELEDTLREELSELDISEDQKENTIRTVMDQLGRGAGEEDLSDEEYGDEDLDDGLDDDEGEIGFGSKPSEEEMEY